MRRLGIYKRSAPIGRPEPVQPPNNTPVLYSRHFLDLSNHMIALALLRPANQLSSILFHLYSIAPPHLPPPKIRPGVTVAGKTPRLVTGRNWLPQVHWKTG